MKQSLTDRHAHAREAPSLSLLSALDAVSDVCDEWEKAQPHDLPEVAHERKRVSRAWLRRTAYGLRRVRHSNAEPYRQIRVFVGHAALGAGIAATAAVLMTVFIGR